MTGSNSRLMTTSIRAQAIEEYLTKHVRCITGVAGSQVSPGTMARIRKALNQLPSETAARCLSGAIRLAVSIESDPGLPLGMRTRCDGPPDSRRYTIVIYEEHQTWPEDYFIGSFLRELAHVVAGQPPEREWPTSRSQRARFKELLENQADATVWKWGLKEYSMRYILATYPPHRVQLIVTEIETILREGFSTGPPMV